MTRILTEEQKLKRNLKAKERRAGSEGDKIREKASLKAKERRAGPEGDKIREKIREKTKENRDIQYIINEKIWFYQNLELIELFDKVGINKDNKNLYDKFYPQYDIETIKRIVSERRKWNDKIKHNYEKEIIV